MTGIKSAAVAGLVLAMILYPAVCMPEWPSMTDTQDFDEGMSLY